MKPPAGHCAGDCTQSLMYTQSLIRSLYTQSFAHSPSQDTVTHGRAGREKERETDASTQSLTISLSLTAPHTHTVRLSSPLQSITCSTHSPSWMQSLAHSQSLTHCPLQSCQLSCNRNRMSDLSEKEERCVLHRAPELSVYHGRDGMESLTSWRDRKGPEQDTPFQTHFFSYAILPQLCQSPFGFGHHQ